MHNQEFIQVKDAFVREWFSQEMSLSTGLYQLVYDGKWSCSFASDDCYKVLRCENVSFVNELFSLRVRTAYNVPERTVSEILMDIVSGKDISAFICIRRLGNETVQYIKGTLFAMRDSEGVLRINGQITDVSAEQTQHTHSQDIEEMHRAGKNMTGMHFFHYMVEGRRAVISRESSEKSGFPESIDNYPDWVVARGFVAEENKDDWYAFFDAIHRGEPNGVVDVAYHSKADRRTQYYQLSFVSQKNDAGEVVSAIISQKNTTAEAELNNAQSIERAGLIKSIQLVFPEILSCNLTKGTCNVIQSVLETPENVPLDFFLLSRLEGIDPEHREYFKNQFLRKNQLKAIEEGKDRFQLTYRGIGVDGEMHWIETTVVLPENPYSDDILTFAVSRNVDQQKNQEELLRRALADSTEKLDGWLYYNSMSSQAFPGLVYVDYGDGSPSPYAVGTLAKRLDCPEKELALSTCFRIPKEERGALQDAYENAIRSGETSFQTEYRVETDAGEIVWVSNMAVPFEDKDGRRGYIYYLTDITEEHTLMEQLEAHMMEKLAENEKIFDITARHSDRTLCYYDLKTRTAHPWNEENCADCEMTHICFKKFGMEIFAQGDFILPDSRNAAEQMVNEIHKGVPFGVSNIHVLMPDASQRWLEFKYSCLSDGETPEAAVISFSDVTERHEHELAYLQYTQSIASGAANELLFIESCLTEDKVQQLEGQVLTEEEKQMRDSHAQLVQLLRDKNYRIEDRRVVEEFLNRDLLLEKYENGDKHAEREMEVRFPDGTLHWVNVENTLLIDPYTRHIKAFTRIKDITEIKEENIHIRQRADYDAMTGLMRRDAGETLIRRHIGLESSAGGILIILDLDNLKVINDNLGHIVGDKAITGVAAALKEHFSQEDVLIRAGGDEFIVFLPEMGERIEDVKCSLTALQEKLLEISLDDEEDQWKASCSIGCAVQLPEHDTFEKLFQRADVALYHIKRSGKNDFAFFEPEMMKKELESRSKNLLTMSKENEAVHDELKRLLSAMASYYQLILSVNISANKYYVMEEVKGGVFSQLPALGILDDFVELSCRPIHPDDKEGVLASLSRKSLLKAYRNGAKSIYRHFRFYDDGKYRWIEAIVIFYKNERDEVCDFTLLRWVDEKASQLDKLYVEIPADIAARKEELRTLNHRITMEDTLFRCLGILVREEDPNVAFALFLKDLGEYYRADRAYVIEFDFENRVCNNTFEWCAEGVSAEKGNLQGIPLSVIDGWIDRFKTKGGFYVDSVVDEMDHDAEDYKILKLQGIERLLVAPMHRDGQIVGFVGVDNPHINNHDLDLLRGISDFAMEELEKLRLMGELKKISYVDALTGLKNRNQYAKTLNGFDAVSPNTLGVVAADVNGLKEINNTYGQEYGDRVLKQIADTLEEHFPHSAYRIGGDEYMVLCTDLSKEEFQDNVVKLRYAFDEDKTCDVSMGFAWSFDEDRVDVAALLQQADEMRHAEKQSYYHTVLSEGRSVFRAGFVGEVMSEIENDRFVVHYQPQVNIHTGEVVGAEALVRKKADDGSIIMPGSFIPFYEVGGVISHVDLFVLRTACADLRRWMDNGYDLHISVNFSRVTLLEPYIVDVISGISTEYNVPPSAITIEVTETIGKMNEQQLKELIVKIKAAGFNISLDDFGSQYSNLAILASLDFDEVKFDRSLVSTLEENEKSRVVMESGLGLCRALKGTTSLAEGIETKGQLELLTGYQCDYGQGYYFSRPITFDAFNEFLKDREKK